MGDERLDAIERTVRWLKDVEIIKSVPQNPVQLIEILGGYDDKYKRVDGKWLIRESLSSFFVPPV